MQTVLMTFIAIIAGMLLLALVFGADPWFSRPHGDCRDRWTGYVNATQTISGADSIHLYRRRSARTQQIQRLALKPCIR